VEISDNKRRKADVGGAPLPHVHPPAEKLTVFISYSRADTAFADEVVAGLEYDGGFDVLMDREAIHEGEEWKKRLGALISGADTVVFILSPKSASSPICQWEVDQAKSLSKRIIPVLAVALADVPAPEALAALNYVRFDEGRSFMAGLTGLRRALKTDIGWLREHTRLLTRAQEWLDATKADNRLLSGKDIADAKAWLAHSSSEGLQPTELHRDFIQASDQAEALRVSAERQRAETLQRAVRWMRIALAGTCVFALAAGAAGLLAFKKQQEAVKYGATAEKLLDELVANLPAGWPEDDTKSPDYRHLAVTDLGRQLKGTEFELTPAVIESIITGNGFVPTTLENKLVVVVRGAILKEGAPTRDVGSVRLVDTRPDHKTLRSVFIVFDRSNSRLTAFLGSSEPSAGNMRAKLIPELRARHGLGERTGPPNNLLPTGLYAYIVGPHRDMPGMLRESVDFAVRRNFNDLTYGLDDEWDVSELAPQF
jgi:hypothetical protein